MREMVISFHPDGTIQHTLKDKFFRPFEGEHRTIHRMSHIEHDSVNDMFYISLSRIMLDGEFITGTVLYSLISKYKLVDVLATLDHQIDCDNDTALFGTYEEAVVMEIELINKIRLAGGYVV